MNPSSTPNPTASPLAGLRICILGAGTLGRALARGLLDTGQVRAEDITATVGHPSSCEAASKSLGVPVTTDNATAARDAQVILLAIKPQKMDAALASLADVCLDDKLLISVAAGVTTARIEATLGRRAAVVRVMPNTPCLLRTGMSAVTGGAHSTSEQVELTRTIFDSVGRTVVIDEALFDGVTALSASGPAYVFVVIESLAEAGVKLGIPREVSTLLAAQTLRGASEMVLQLGAHPALLKDDVTTPAGCTIDGLLELEEGKLRVTLIKAVVKAAERAAQLG